MFRRTTHSTLLLIFGFTSATFAEVREEGGRVVIDGVTIPFGTVIEVEGPCSSEDFLEMQFGPTSLRGLRIDGKATTEKIDFILCASSSNKDISFDRLRKVNEQAYYKARGHLLNARFNGTRNACLLEVEKFEPIAKALLSFADLVDRSATFEGTAVANGKFKLGSDTARLSGLNSWPANVQGKPISIVGEIHRDSQGWRIDHPTWKLIELDDLLDQPVSLDGKLFSSNGEWWFDYRGTRLYLTSAAGPTLSFSSDDHGRAARVTGTLLRQLRPALDQISLKSDRDLVKCFVVRNAKVEYLENVLDWNQRFGPIYPEPEAVRDGVPVLLAEPSMRRNLMGNESDAMLFAERNTAAIEAILRDLSPKKCDVLASRMSDVKLAVPLRLLYAAILARANDQRGRSFLENQAQTKDDQVDLDALYSLGIFPFLAPGQKSIQTDTKWAEKPMITLLSNRKEATVGGKPLTDRFGNHQRLNIAEAAVNYSEIPAVLAMMGTDGTRKTLIDYALANSLHSTQVVEILCDSNSLLPIDDLMKLESISTDSSSRRAILRQLMRHKPPTGIERFLKDLESGFVYMDMRDHSTPEMLTELRKHVDSLSGDAKINLQILLVLGEKDPVPKLLKLLSDSNWTDKNLVLFELARLGDPRGIPIVGGILRDAPKSFLPANSELSNTAAVEHGLDAIARTGTSDAIGELINLLNVDLARFGTYIDRQGFQRIVAAHLIELTGESFGTDAEAWKKWHTEHPEFNVNRRLANPESVFRTDASDQVDLGQ